MLVPSSFAIKVAVPVERVISKPFSIVVFLSCSSAFFTSRQSLWSSRSLFRYEEREGCAYVADNEKIVAAVKKIKRFI